MRFDPKTEKEIAEENLWPAGIYDFEVLEAEDTVSKTSGNEMIKLRVKIFNEESETQTIFDYLLSSMPGKLRHAAAAFGVLADYERGSFDAFSCIGKVGKCKVSIQKDKTGQFPDKNGIADYIVPAPETAAPGVRDPKVVSKMMDNYDRGTAAAARQKAPAGDLDDEIPF